LASLVHQAFPEGDVFVVNGDVAIAKHFADLPFGHLIFTGSTQVGYQIMRAASDHLTPVTLELGGKSPAVISRSCPDEYLPRLLMGKCLNAGQTCIAPDYALIPTAKVSGFQRVVAEFVKKRFPKMPNDRHYSSIVSTNHFQQLLTLMDEAKQKGAEIIPFGDISEAQRKIPLTLVLNPSDDMTVMKEEIFGPLLPVITYDDIDEAISQINKHPNPLALYYFGHDKEEIETISKRQLSGALTINDAITHVAIDDLPFGGVGESGIGCYHGREGFERFSLMKPVFIQRKIAPVTWLYPPYGKIIRLFLKWVGKLNIKDES